MCVGLITIIAGGMTSVVGGGGNLTLPTLFALGFTAALTVGLSRLAFFSGACVSVWKQRARLRSRRQRIRVLIVFGVCLLGGYMGSYVVLALGDKIIRLVAPVFLLLAVYTFFGERREALPEEQIPEVPMIFESWWQLILLFLIALYGGTLGGGVATMLMATLMSMVPNESPRRVFAVRQSASLAFNSGAIIGYAPLMFSNVWIGLWHPSAVTAYWGSSVKSAIFLAPEFLAVLMVPAAMIGANWGNYFVESVLEHTLRLVMGWVSLVLVIVLIVRNLPEYATLLKAVFF